MGAVCVFGDKGWWLWVVIPLYSGWLAWTTVMGMKSGLAGLGGAAAGGVAPGNDAATSGSESKRQKKMEKRGGQRVQYR